MLNSSQFNSNLRKEIKLELLNNLTLECYENVNKAHSKILEESSIYKVYDEEPWCPRTFDGFACWDAAPPDTTAYQSCPDYVIGFDSTRLVYKSCTENGTWVSLDGKKPWTNYDTCVDIDDLNFRNMVNHIYVVGYSLSVAALILAILIFMCFKSLMCTRVRIHIHQFSSLALSGLMWIILFKSVFSFASIAQENMMWCQVLHLVMNYFMVSSYMWMFNEALHLNIVLVVVFLDDERAMRWFTGVGWGLPFLITAVYGLFRGFVFGDTERCWMGYSKSTQIITVPIVLTLIASTVFLVSILYVLLTKLPGPRNQVPFAIKRAVRATFMLIPLFGLHFMLIPLSPLRGFSGEKVYQVVSAILISFQGICVAILFCFTNREVQTAIRSRLNRVNQNRDLIPMTGMNAAENAV